MRASSVSFVVLILVLGAACKTYDPLYCDGTQDCTDPDRPFCDLNGDYPASDGVARTCIPDPNASDAGDDDGGAPDASMESDAAGVFSYPEPRVYWAFDEADISGSTLQARTGAISGTFQGTALDANGVVGDAFVFGGGTDHVDFGTVLDDVFSGPDRKFTVSVWIRPASVAGNQRILIKCGVEPCQPPEENLQFEIQLKDGLPQLRLWTPGNDNARYVSATTPLVLDVWQHLLISYDGAIDLGPVDRVRIYVDGVPQPLTVAAQIGPFPFDIEPTDAHLALGKAIGAAGTICGPQELLGTLDELAVWSSLLSAEEAAQVHTRGSASQPLWPL